MSWLSSDERCLLAGYFRSIKEVDGESAFREDRLAELFNGKLIAPEYGEPDDVEPINENRDRSAAISQIIIGRKRVAAANQLLAARKLITYTRHRHEQSVVILGLTLEGYDLGLRYSSWFMRTHLWFREYKDHWMMLLIGFVGGMLGSLIIDLLKGK
jgi:hypothetical protein